VERGYSPYQLAAVLWDHAPAMWALMAKKEIPRPQLTEQDASDLFAYFFAARYFETPGNSGRGRGVFRTKQCGLCHGVSSPAREGVKPVAQWQSLDNPIALAQQMWNHASEMRAAHDQAKLPYPRLSPQQLTDLLAYLRGRVGSGKGQAEFSPGSAAKGQELYKTKGCAACHIGRMALETRTTRHTLADFAASMWDHPFQVQFTPAELSYQEMRELVGYLISMQFFEERGNLEQGRRVYERKGCGACHDNPASGAPARSDLAGRMTSFALVAALWQHGPQMLEHMQKGKVSWPTLTGEEMADLGAYLHGLEFKRRPAR
jgi:mono/diheme cytochrome c family protein